MIGFDIQEVDKIKNGKKLLEKIALESEIQYIQKFKCDYKMRIATLWAVKEAVFKALNDCVDSYKEIELCHKENGAPYILLHGQTKSNFEKLGGKNIEISISHQKNIVGAVCIAFKNTEE